MVTREQAKTDEGSNHELVDLRLVKKRALETLPPGDPVREAIVKEPDLLPRSEGLVKLATYARVLMSKRAR
jgi:hypothetical protein